MDICETQQFDYLQHEFIMNLVENVLKDPNERQELFMEDRKQSIRQSIYTNNQLQNPLLNRMNAITKSSALLQDATAFDNIQVLQSVYGPAWSTIESDELLYPNQKHYVPSGRLSSSLDPPSANPYALRPNRCNSFSRTLPKENFFVKKLPLPTYNYQPDAAQIAVYAQLLSAVEQLQNAAQSDNHLQRQPMPYAKNTSIKFTPFHCNSTNCNTLSSIETQNTGQQVNDLNENRLFKDQCLGQKFLQTEVPNYKKRSEETPMIPFCTFCRKNNET